MGSKQSKPIQASTPILETTAKANPATPAADNEENNDASRKLPLNHPKVNSTEGGECPYKNPVKSISGFFGRKKGQEVSVGNNTNNGAASNSDSACPVKASSRTNALSQSACPVKSNSSKVQYNVYSQPIDPTNNMPSVANQLPAPMQNEELSTERVRSTIPKGGSDSDTWTYPSPQMFYNSLARKNKLGDTKESEIESVVAIHNNMNEKTWAKVMEWEKVLCPDSNNEISTNGGSKLLKFLGRPSDLSLKARFKNLLFGHPLPFDRHDWTIVRPDGTEVTYVIDYYVDDTKASDKEDSGMPNMHDRDAIKSILVDVRPAAESPGTIFGRAVTMPFARHIEKSTRFEPLPIIPSEDLKNQISESEKVWENIQKNVEESKHGMDARPKSMVLKQNDIPDEQKEGSDATIGISDEEAKEIAKSFATMLESCKSSQALVENCQSEAECAKASLAVTMCLAKVVCPVQQGAVANALNADDFDPNDEEALDAYNAKFEKALETMTLCVTGKSRQAAMAREKYPELFESLGK